MRTSLSLALALLAVLPACSDRGLITVRECGLYPDVDGDGVGDALSESVCAINNRENQDAGILPDGFSAQNADCDDSDRNVTGTFTFFVDADLDGFGAGDGVEACTPELACEALDTCSDPATMVLDDPDFEEDDCDDANAAIHPAADEICDDAGVDEDCDGLVNDNDNDAVGAETAWFDQDDDGYGDPAEAETYCGEIPRGFVDNDLDCLDADPTRNPETTWRIDFDRDLIVGDNTTFDKVQCEPPGAGYVQLVAGDPVDCDDNDPSIGSERTWYEDLDGDTYGNAERAVTEGCEPPADHVADATDCDDTSDAVFPGAPESCNEIDDDCNGTVDDDYATDAQVWFVDSDGDGYAASTTGADLFCYTRTGWTQTLGDCNDADALISPDAVEICDSADVDEDCNGLADDADTITDTTTDAVAWYEDRDGDEYGDPDSVKYFCDAPSTSDWVEDDTDCEPLHDYAYPGSHETEVPGDGIDTDCDGDDFCHDLNCDGWPDLVAPGSYDGDHTVEQAIWYYDGSAADYTTSERETWTLTNGVPWTMTVVDADDDGYLDLAAGLYRSTSRTGLNHPLYWGGARSIPTAGSVTAVDDAMSEPCFGDFNNDGHLDWVNTEYVQGESFFVRSSVRMGSSSGFVFSGLRLSHDGATECDVADLDGDGFDDILIPGWYDNEYDTDSIIFWGSSSGLSNSDKTALPSMGARGTVMTDLDGDGDLDIVIANNENGSSLTVDSYVYWNNAGFRTSDRTGLPANNPWEAVVADLDDDGHLDIVFPGFRNSSRGYSTDTYIYWGNSSDFTTSRRTSLSSTGALSAAVADFNGDGDLDLALGQHRDGSDYTVDSRVFYGDGTRTGFSSSSSVDLPGNGPRYVSAADLNLDGYDDFIVPGNYDGSSYSVNGFVYWGSSSGLSTSDYTAIPSNGGHELIPVGKGIISNR